MQTEAAPREPFTFGVLLRYKFTIALVALFVVAAGYLRIVTQPALYEATARLAVRFTAEAIALQDVASRGSFYRPPLLEEEVKAYMVEMTSTAFLKGVLSSLPPDEAPPSGEPVPPPPEPTALERIRAELVRTYSDLRNAAFSFIRAVLLTPETMLSEDEQQVARVLARLSISAGTDASHLITISYRHPSPAYAAKVANAIAEGYIAERRKQLKEKPIESLQKEIEKAQADLVKYKAALHELQDQIGAATIEEAIRKKHTYLDGLRDEYERLVGIRKLLQDGLLVFDSKVSVGSQLIVGELERQFLAILVRFEEENVREPEKKQFHVRLVEAATQALDRLKALEMKRYLAAVEERIAFIERETQKVLADKRYAELSVQYASLDQLQRAAETRLRQTEMALAEAEAYNEQLKNKDVSENVRIWQRAPVPPFPLSQHRELKFAVVIVFGLLAGLGAAVIHHNLRPRRGRRARPRHEEEVSAPLILLAEESNPRQPTASPEVTVSFPPGEAPRRRP